MPRPSDSEGVGAAAAPVLSELRIPCMVMADVEDNEFCVS